jgi:hypothetical protein
MLYDNPRQGLSLNSSSIAKDFYQKYKLKDTLKPYMINSFSKIGWQDPFPNDIHMSTKCCKKMKKMDIEDLVYPENRMVEGEVPDQVYIPSKELMIKIMRSCIDISHCRHGHDHNKE